MATDQANATTAQDDALVAGLFESTTEALPDFSKMKKQQLIDWAEDHQAELYEGEKAALSLDDFGKLTVKEMRAHLIEAMSEGDELLKPEVTGLNPSDPIHATVIEVQQLASEKAAVELVRSLYDGAKFNDFKIGGILAEMRSKGWMGEYDDFWTFVEATFGYKIRQAQIKVQIYEALVSCGATYDEVQDIGWGKLMVFASQLTPENYKDWLAKAKDQTQAGLVELVKEYKQANAGGEGGADLSDLESTPIKKLSFSVHEDQVPTIKEALAKAKDQSGSDFDGNALEQIAAEFLAQVPTMPVNAGGSPNLRPLFQKFSADEDGAAQVLEQFCEVFPDAHVELYPDGKPSLAVVLEELLDEHGATEVGEVFDQLTQE